jgi:two-component system, LytTR family, response regulator
MKERTLNAIIVDDEPQAIDNLEKLLINIPVIRIIDKENDPEKALEKIIHYKPDLLFTDINMPGKSGFELVSDIFHYGLKPEIIFVTAFDKYAIRAIRYAAFDFLLKPVNREELELAVRRLLERKQETVKDEQFNILMDHTIRRPKIKFNTTGGFIMIKPEEIVYIQADWNYADIFFDNETSETVTMNIGSLEALLPSTEFFRLNRSVIINTNYLARVSRKKLEAILIKDGKEYRFKIPLLNIRKLESFLSK